MLAYHFPPIGGSGAQRPVKFARYLPEVSESEWVVDVVTGPGRSVDRWSPIDETLLSDVSANTNVHRVEGPEIVAESRWLRRAERWLRLTSAWTRWWQQGAYATALTVAGSADVIVVSMPPYQSAPVGAALARDLGVPWVADLRDPWALDEMTIYGTRVHRILEQRNMRVMLRTAAAIVTTTPEAARRISSAFPELCDRPIVSIPNGYDESDFAPFAPRAPDGTLRIVHTGYLHTELGRRATAWPRRLFGGGVAGTNLLGRSHVYLVDAIERIQRDPGLHVELHLAGVMSEADRETTQRITGVVTHGYLRHSDAVRLMQTADLLFLPMHQMPSGMRSGIVPGKTYEYIAAGPPILAAIPEGDARDILVEAGNSYICEPSDAVAIERILRAELDRRRGSPQLPPTVNREVLHRFERRTLASRYQDVLETVVAATPTMAFSGGA